MPQRNPLDDEMMRYIFGPPRRRSPDMDRLREIAERVFDALAEIPMSARPGAEIDIIEQALREAQAGAWVPVGDIHPPLDADVLVRGRDDNDDIAVAWQAGGVGWVGWDGERSYPLWFVVTHWRPLPPPPAKENAATTCKLCNGRGKHPETDDGKCPVCDGTGEESADGE